MYQTTQIQSVFAIFRDNLKPMPYFNEAKKLTGCIKEGRLSS